MKLKLDKSQRKFIEIEIENDGKISTIKYYEKNTKQIKALKQLSRKENAKMIEIDDLVEVQFFENLQGENSDIESLVSFYEENGNIYEFINMCDQELGKLKKKD
jgi:hypothetical protein